MGAWVTDTTNLKKSNNSMENYERLLEKARLLKMSECSKNVALDELFPELIKTDDDTMRKQCIKYLDYEYQHCSREEDKKKIERCVTWLENQKFANTKFRIGDVVTNGEHTYTIDKISSDCYWVKEHDCATIPFESESLWRIVEPENAGWISDLQHANIVYQQAMNVNMVIEAKNLVKSGLEKANIWDLVVDTIKNENQNNDTEKEKSDFVSGKFLYCRGSFLDFKEGETYWLEYIGDDNYIGRSDNVLNQKFHITPRLLYTWFVDKLPEKEDTASRVTDNVMPENLKPYDEEISALDWTITALKSRLKLFSAANSEGVRYLENLLSKLRKQQDL